MKEFESEIRFQFRALDHYPVLFISSITHQRVHKVLETAWAVYQRSRNIISTAKLNDMIEKVVRKNPPPAEQGKVIRINYAAQVHRQPAVIAFFTNYPKLIKISYRRFLENRVRSVFDLTGLPLKFSFRRK